MCMRRLEAKSWDVAVAELHGFMDQRERDMAKS